MTFWKRFPFPPGYLTYPAALAVGAVIAWTGGSGSHKAVSGHEAKDSSSGGEVRAVRRDAGLPPGLFHGAHYAAAWEMLKDRKLARDERTRVQAALVADWALVDLEAAVKAILSKRKNEGPGSDLLDACDKGILAAIPKGWELIQGRAFGWETARFRKAWISKIAEKEPLGILPHVDRLTPFERLKVADSLAEHLWIVHLSDTDKDAGLREQIKNGILAMGKADDGEEILRRVGSTMGHGVPREEILRLLSGDVGAEAMKLHAAAFVSSFSTEESFGGPVDDMNMLPPPGDGEGDAGGTGIPDKIRSALAELPASQREAVTRAGLALPWKPDFFLPYADAALADGHLDLLEEVGKQREFKEHFLKNPHGMDSMAAWAIALPADERLRGLYGDILQEAAERGSVVSVDQVRELPPGWKRDLGLAILAPVMDADDQDPGVVGRLIGEIADPGLQEEARKRLVQKEADRRRAEEVKELLSR